MRIVFALLVLCFLILPAGCGGGDDPSDGDGTPVQEPVTNTAEELNEILPPPDGGSNP